MCLILVKLCTSVKVYLKKDFSKRLSERGFTLAPFRGSGAGFAAADVVAAAAAGPAVCLVSSSPDIAHSPLLDRTRSRDRGRFSEELAGEATSEAAAETARFRDGTIIGESVSILRIRADCSLSLRRRSPLSFS